MKKELRRKQKLEKQKFKLKEICIGVFNRLSKKEIREVLNDPIFYFRYRNNVLQFVRKNLNYFEKLFLKKPGAKTYNPFQSLNNNQLKKSKSDFTFIKQKYS